MGANNLCPLRVGERAHVLLFFNGRRTLRLVFLLSSLFQPPLFSLPRVSRKHNDVQRLYVGAAVGSRYDLPTL